MNASFRTSLPICSPSRSQSVQMNRILDKRACCCIFFARHFLSCLVISQCINRLLIYTHFLNYVEDGRIKELSGRTGFPAFVLRLEFKASEVAKNTRHRNRAIAPLLEVEFEIVVLNILISCNGTLSPRLALQAALDGLFTNSIDSAATQMLCHSLRNCRFLSDTKDSSGRHAVSSKNKIRLRGFIWTSTIDV
jgi:hypothetical protein